MNNRRSASVGALPVEKKHFVSRNESVSGALLDVRCACQYFQCDSLLPDRINPVESRPTSKQGFVNDMEHGDHQHFDNMSARSFNMMGRQTEFDRISAASFGGRMHGMEGRGLVVRSISDATEQEMVGSMMAGHRGRQMSIGGMSSGSFGGRDPDAVSIRSGISLRRVSRSPSHADLFVADLNIPTPHVPGQPRRGSRGEIPKLNIVAPTPTPTPGVGKMSAPDFSIYDRKTMPPAKVQQNHWAEENKENHLRQHGGVLPQNKPIDVSRYADRDEFGRPISEPMDVDFEVIEPVIDIKDSIKIDRMSPPLQESVPDLSPVVEDETRIEIRDFAPQPDLRPIEEILADDRPPGHMDTLNIPGQSSPPSQSSQLSQLKRQHAHEREMSPDYSKKQFMQKRQPTDAQSFQREPSPGVQHMDTGDFMQRGSSTARLGMRGSSPALTSSHHVDTRQLIQRGAGAKSFQRGSSPNPPGMQHTDAKQFMHYGSSPTVSSAPTSTPLATGVQRASSPAPTSTYQREIFRSGSPSATGEQSFQRASSAAPTSTYQREPLRSGSPPFQRGTSPTPGGSGQFMQSGSQPSAMEQQSFQRASSPAPTGNRTDTKQLLQRPSSTASGMHHMDVGQSFERETSPVPIGSRQFMQRGSPPTVGQSFQRASSPAPANIQHMETRQFMHRGPPAAGQHMDVPHSIEKPHDDKQSYSSRFMSMFHSKTPDPTATLDKLETPPQEKRKMSLSHLLHMDRTRSPSPGKQIKADHSPRQARLMSVFKREYPTAMSAMSVVEGSHLGNVSIRKGPEEKLLTVRVTETFSLKVDEMDQYSNHPPKSPSPVRHTRLYASSEHLGLTQDRLSESMDFSADRRESFAPVIVSSARSSQMQLQAGDRSHYMSSSQSDLRGSRRFDSHEHIPPPAPHTTTFAGNKKLISVPIAVPDFYDSEMTSSEFIHEGSADQPSYTQPHRSNLIKAPSEQRLAQSKLIQRKLYTSDRTQSQDRAAADRASELDSLSISTRSMTKTVSFSFGEHGSRLSQHEKMVSSNNQLDQSQWLERTYFSRDHEYEPIGEPSIEIQNQETTEPQVSALKKEPSPAPAAQELPKLEVSQPSLEIISDEASSPSKSEELKEVEEFQKDIEDRYFSSAATTPRTESRNDYDVHTSQVDSSALEELPLKPENRKKSFMASAQDRTRKMQAGLKNQAGKIKTKFRSPKKVPSGSPKAKDRKRFKAPEFSKIKMPEMKRPDLSGFKRPEFTKFSKPDMSKFKLPDKFSSLKLTRSKSFKESTEVEDTTVSGTTPESTSAPIASQPKKQKFDFSFGTYPRAFRKKKKPQEAESAVDEPSVIPSTETQPSAESSSTPQGDRGPGPVRSRWADKFSDVSYNDSEGSRYRRYGSEQDSSFDRESSMERRMKEVLEENAKEEAELAMLGVVEQKQFADYDEENRVIHEISKTREREFKRRPMVHQDSDLVSEEGRDIGWSEREAQKNQILRKAELEAEAKLKYLSERDPNSQAGQNRKKLIFEQINPDEFLLRNKGVSQDFDIANQRFLDPHMEAGFDNSPNSLEFLGTTSLHGSSIDHIDYGYDVPPPKPRRLSHQQRQRHYDSENASQIDDDVSLSQAESDYFRNAPPSRPLRKGRFKNSQDISIGGTPSVQFDDEDFTDQRDRDRILHQEDDEEKENIRNDSPMPPPQPPRRRRKQRDSLEKDSYVNGFGGRSVSNSYLKEDNKPEEVIVYRTEHEYKIPLATPENYTDTSATPRKSRSLSRLGMDEDDRTSRGADSPALDAAMRGENNNIDDEELQEKYIIEMMENDGYAIVRKDNLPKPTPPARRKKFSRSPGERFATMPHLRKGSPSVPEQKSSSRNYSAIGRPTPPRRKSALSLGADSQKDFGRDDFSDYEVPELDDRTESPRNLQSGDIINKMKYRPLPPPPRPPREKRHTQRDRHGDDDDEFDSRDDRDDRDGGGERIISDNYTEQSSDDYNLQENVDKSIEVEVSTQTDPLPDDFVCEEFEITEDMKIIEPTRSKTLDEILKEEEEADLERARQIDDEILQRGIQRFREASQRTASEKSRASSQAKSLSRPQTPSAILIEKRVPTPVPNSNGQTVLEASLTVQPIDDLDLEEELLRREGLYDGSHSKSDADSRYRDDEEAGHGSEEENARIGEEERSYTRSTDAESQRRAEEEEEERLLERILREDRLEEQRLEEERLEDQKLEEQRLENQKLEEQRLEEQRLEEQRLEEKRLEEQRLQEEEEEENRLLEELENERRLEEQKLEEQRLEEQRLEEQRLEEQRLQEEEEEENRLLEELEKERKLEEQRLEEERLEEQRLEEERLEDERLEEERLQEEEDEQNRLLEELEREQRLLEEEQLKLLKLRLLEQQEKLLRLQEEEERKQRIQDEMEKEQRLHPEPDRYADEQNERLELADTHEVSEDKHITPPPSPPPPPAEEVIPVLREKKLLSKPKPIETESDEEATNQPPTAPPRKRSYAAPVFEDQTESLSVAEQQPTTSPVPLTTVMPSHLALADLEVERLRVHALQAGQIMVSHLHGAQIQADELECRSGNLVVRNIELPPGFIEDIVERVRSTERDHTQAGTQTISDVKTHPEDPIPPPPIPTRQSDIPPVRPPPPKREYMQPAPSAPFLQLRDPDEPPILPRSVLPTDYLQSVPPIGFYRNPDDDGEPTPPVYRRRRHHRRRDSSSEEEQPRHRSRSARSEPQTVAQAGRQFISACSLPLANVINQLTNAIRPNNDNKQDQVQPRNISTLVVLFIVMTLSFLLYLLSGRNIHHHHWDYFNPPGNDGRLS